jgi:transcriptional regulator with XRE-family HTH domain/tetratricopeptide (TPR) repeat protein
MTTQVTAQVSAQDNGQAVAYGWPKMFLVAGVGGAGLMSEQLVAGFAGLLRRLRIAARLTQEELAEAAGVSFRTVSDLERGINRTARNDTALLLASALDLTGPTRSAFVAAARGRISADDVLAASQGKLPPVHFAAGSGGQDAVVPRQLPAAVRQFVGRTRELKALAALLDQAGGSEGTVPTAVISGPGGVGKTALAVHWAHSVADRFPDGQLFVDLRGFDPSGAPVSPAEAIRIFLEGFGVPAERIPISPVAQAGLYRSIAAGKRLLIALDNARDAGQVRPLLPGSRGCLVLVTSRSRLTGLIAADGAHAVGLDVLAEDEAVQLLGARLGPERLAGSPAAVGRLTQVGARLPLALAIIAARATASPEIPLTALAAQLESEPDQLDAFETGEDATSLRAVLSWSCRHLSDPAARMFRLLSLHPGPDISVAAAASLAAAPVHQARRALAELVSAGLISELVPGRYGFHELLRACAAGQARESEDETARRVAIHRILDHYLHTGAAAAILLRSFVIPLVMQPCQAGVTPEPLADRHEAMSWYQAERRVLVAVTALAGHAGFDTHGWQIPEVVRNYLYMAGHWQDRETVSELAMEAARRLGDDTALGMAQLAMGSFRYRIGAHDDAFGHVSESIRHLRLTSDLVAQAYAQVLLAEIGRSEAGPVADDLRHADQGLALARAAGHRVGEAYALGLIGNLHVHLGRPALGIDYCERSLALLEELGDPADIAAAFDNLGRAQLEANEAGAAILSFQQAISLWKEVGYTFGRASTLLALGDAFDASADHHAARHAWLQGLEVLGELHHPDADRVRTQLLAPPAS